MLLFYLILFLLIILFHHIFFFLLIIDSYFLVPAAIAQFFNLFAVLLIPIGITIKEAKAKIEIHPVIVEAKIGKYSI